MTESDECNCIYCLKTIGAIKEVRPSKMAWQPICMDCFNKNNEKYNRLLKFAKFSAETASCHACDYQSMLAEKLLQEIGEIV